MALQLQPGARGVELGYAEITSSFALTTTATDVTGLSVTVTVGSRPIVVEAYAPAISNATADKTVVMRISEGATQLQQGIGVPAVSTGFAEVNPSIRINPAAGSHTYKVLSFVQSGSASGTLVASATAPAYIRVVEC